MVDYDSIRENIIGSNPKELIKCEECGNLTPKIKIKLYYRLTWDGKRDTEMRLCPKCFRRT